MRSAVPVFGAENKRTRLKEKGSDPLDARGLVALCRGGHRYNVSSMDMQTRNLLSRRELLLGSAALWEIFPQCCYTPVLRDESVDFEARSFSIDLQKAVELRQVGSAAAVISRERDLNIIVIRAGKHKFVALDRSCTHNGAQCTYDRKRRTVRCTSLNHAEFDLKGTLLHGRTHGNLRAYTVRLKGSTLQVQL